jgi:hypothetical protein
MGEIRWSTCPIDVLMWDEERLHFPKKPAGLTTPPLGCVPPHILGIDEIRAGHWYVAAAGSAAAMPGAVVGLIE